MSNRLLTAAWRVRGLTCAEKAVLTRLADFANEQSGECFPSHKRIAQDCALSERTVQEVLRRLAGKHHITIKEDAQRATRSDSRFTYVLHPLTPEAGAGVAPEIGAADTGIQPLPHRKLSVATPVIGAAPYITIMNQNNHQGNRAPGKASLSATERISLENELAEIKLESKAIAANYEGLQDWTPSDKERSYALKRRKKEVLSLLGRIA